MTIFAIVFFFSNLFLIRPYFNKLTDLQDEKELITEKKQSMSINILMNAKYEDSLKTIESEYEKIDNQIMENKTFDEIDEILSAEFAKRSLTIMQFEIQDKKSVGKDNEEETDISNLHTVSVTVTAQGEKQNIYNLIDDFSKDSKTDVIDFFISDQSQSTQIIISFEYVMYK